MHMTKDKIARNHKIWWKDERMWEERSTEWDEIQTSM